eukprot:8680095-Heterocapsa_arctica.AAC.1
MEITFFQSKTNTVMIRLQITKTNWNMKMTHNRGVTQKQRQFFGVALTKRKAAANANTQLTPNNKKSKSHRNLTENHGQMLRAYDPMTEALTEAHGQILRA